jgi:hypothetical protein
MGGQGDTHVGPLRVGATKIEKGGWHLSLKGASHLFRFLSAYRAGGVLQAVRADGGDAATRRLSRLERNH